MSTSGEVENMTTEQLKDYLDAHGPGEYNLIDVRQAWEYEEFHIPGAKLIPLPELPDRLGEIAVDKPTLVYCAVGGRSASAANFMGGQGFESVYNVLGGIMAWKNEYAVGPETRGMMDFSGDESPLEILARAFKMETDLGTFYSEMAASAEPDLADTFQQLSRFEKGHKAIVFNLARDVDPLLKNYEDMEKRRSGSVLEGGITAEEFLRENKEYLGNPKGVLEAAMMFETQALDFYMRIASKTERGESIELLHTLAQEEKKHLKILGKLMDRKFPAES